MKRLNSQKGIMPIIVAIIFAVILVSVGLGGYLLVTNKTKPQPAVPKVSLITPEETVRDYYNAVLDCENAFGNAIVSSNASESARAGKILQECRRNADTKYTSSKTDSSIAFPCSQSNPPTEISIEKTTINGNSAESVVHTLYKSSEGSTIGVGLQIADGKWKIANTSCSIVDPTANWKTYTSKYNTYSIKYPQGWYIYEYKQGGGTGISDIPNPENMPQTISPRGHTHIIVGELFPSSRIFKDASSIEVSINSYAGVRREVGASTNQTDSWGLGEVVDFYNPNGGNNVEITKYVDDKQMFDQILSTFKFTQ